MWKNNWKLFVKYGIMNERKWLSLEQPFEMMLKETKVAEISVLHKWRFNECNFRVTRHLYEKKPTEFYQKGHKSELFTEKMPSGNSEVLFLVRRTLAEIPKLGFILPQRTYNFASNFSSMCKNCTLTVSSIICLNILFFF